MLQRTISRVLGSRFVALGRHARQDSRLARAASVGVEMLEQRVFLTAATVNPGDDSYVRNGTYASTNFGSATQLQVKTIGQTSFDRDGYLKFAVSIPGGNVLNSAVLSVYGIAVVG